MALNKPFNRGPRLPFKRKEAEHNINQFIKAPEVRLVGDNVEQGVYSLRDAEVKKIPYMLIVGEKETAEGMVSVRKHGHGDLGSMSIEDFKQQIIKEITV